MIFMITPITSTDKRLRRMRPLEKIPLFVKAGAIIPMSAREAYVDPQKDTYRELMVFPFIKAGEAINTIYDDDGESFRYQNNEYLQLMVKLRLFRNKYLY
ncbi:alpha-glucosidase [Actinobacillus pleuropneumoniae]|nr:alpha-glucosidase [Actinobacillus pleuropneumoniae]